MIKRFLTKVRLMFSRNSYNSSSSAIVERNCKFFFVGNFWQAYPRSVSRVHIYIFRYLITLHFIFRILSRVRIGPRNFRAHTFLLETSRPCVSIWTFDQRDTYSDFDEFDFTLFFFKACIQSQLAATSIKLALPARPFSFSRADRRFSCSSFLSWKVTSDF